MEGKRENETPCEEDAVHSQTLSHSLVISG